MLFQEELKLDTGTHYFWVSYQVDEQANLLHFVDASLIGVTFQEGKKEEWWLWAPAPGRGIVMADGTLVFPTQGRDAS